MKIRVESNKGIKEIEIDSMRVNKKGWQIAQAGKKFFISKDGGSFWQVPSNNPAVLMK